MKNNTNRQSLKIIKLKKYIYIVDGVPLTLSQTSPGFYVPAIQIFRKLCGKRRNCSQRAISLFPQCFLPVWKTFWHFNQI